MITIAQGSGIGKQVLVCCGAGVVRGSLELCAGKTEVAFPPAGAECTGDMSMSLCTTKFALHPLPDTVFPGVSCSRLLRPGVSPRRHGIQVGLYHIFQLSDILTFLYSDKWFLSLLKTGYFYTEWKGGPNDLCPAELHQSNLFDIVCQLLFFVGTRSTPATRLPSK